MTAKNKGPLTKVEKFYIDNNKNKKVEELAEDLSRTEKAIKKYLDATAQPDDNNHIAKAKSDSPTAGDMMIKNERYGVSIMTQEASMNGDESKSKSSQLNPNFVHKMKED
tara:strand:- start:654 stop:983 length:330 start_codon:yes stop_codon:yes gene_type:complete